MLDWYVSGIVDIVTNETWDQARRDAHYSKFLWNGVVYYADGMKNYSFHCLAEKYVCGDGGNIYDNGSHESYYYPYEEYVKKRKELLEKHGIPYFVGHKKKETQKC